MPVMNLNALAVELERDEGRRHFVYRDSVGKLSAGVGRNLDDKGLRDSEIDLMLKNDIREAVDGLYRVLPWVADLDDDRQRVLANMTFNMGLRTLLTFKLLLAAVQAGNYSRARECMLQSLWARQVGPRAYRLADLMWPPPPPPSLPPVA